MGGMSSSSSLTTARSRMRIVIEGCMHGELDKVYSTLLHMEKVENKKIDLLICCGDFQSVRNPNDLDSLNVLPKYKKMGTFWKYYSGQLLAPFPTIFIGGNHEASNYLWELYYGGWAAPNIYFMGYAGVVKFGNLRIGGLSGIYNNKDGERYKSGHHERYPYNSNDIRSVYHTREYEVQKLMQITQPIDIFISHDWPRGIARYGNMEELLCVKPEAEFKQDVLNNCLGSPPAELLLHELKPKFWFSAHHHCKFAAMVQHGYKGPITRFLALDKCLRNRSFLQAIDIIEDGPKVVGPPYEIHYDEEWLAITKKFNSIFPLTREPAKYGLLQFDKKSIEEYREWVIDKLEKRGTRKPFDFVQTVPPYCPIVSSSVASSRSSDYLPPGINIRNPQTDSLMHFLELPYVL